MNRLVFFYIQQKSCTYAVNLFWPYSWIQYFLYQCRKRCVPKLDHLKKKLPSAHYNFIFAYFTSSICSLQLHLCIYFTSSICSLHPRVIFMKGNDNFNVTFWKKTAFQWLFYSRPSNFTSFLVEGTRTFLERPFSLFWVNFLLTC